ncbi:MAG: outer membrane beta-barrel protein [Bacteroidota bacterium]|nr:outer membrane beta-barrel protein [Bacteroidota bacterium]
MIKRMFVFIMFCSIVGIKANAQSSPPNMPEYDEQVLHFGVTLGYNSLYSNMVKKADLPLYDTIMGFSSHSEPGLAIGVSADLRLLSFLHLRFIPTLVLSERTFVYNVLKNDNYTERRNSLEVIYLEAPLELKIQSKRYHNFRPYLLAGGKFVYDMGSIKRKKLKPEEYLMKLENKELFYTLGVGFDFYLPMCKIGIELKSSFGLTDILDHNFNNAYTDCLDKIKSQIFYINITFE